MKKYPFRKRRKRKNGTFSRLFNSTLSGIANAKSKNFSTHVAGARSLSDVEFITSLFFSFLYEGKTHLILQIFRLRPREQRASRVVVVFF